MGNKCPRKGVRKKEGIKRNSAGQEREIEEGVEKVKEFINE